MKFCKTCCKIFIVISVSVKNNDVKTGTTDNTITYLLSDTFMLLFQIFAITLKYTLN